MKLKISGLQFFLKSVSCAALLLASSSAFAEQCSYNLDQNSLVVGFTAYKTTKKVAVNGTFKKSHVHGKTSGDSVATLVQGLHAMVDLSSVDTGNPVRDKTLNDFFFSKLKPAVSAMVRDFSEKDKKFVLSLEFNGHHKDVPMTYAVTGDSAFQATGDISLSDFGGDDALASIHEKCLDLHKGPDGVSKTWGDVTLNLKGAVTRSCQ